MMQLVHRYVRPTPALPMRQRTQKDKARRLATALAASMLLFTSLSLMFRGGRRPENALAPDGAPPPPVAHPVHGADAVALAQTQAVAMADAAAEHGAKHPVSVDGSLRAQPVDGGAQSLERDASVLNAGDAHADSAAVEAPAGASHRDEAAQPPDAAPNAEMVRASAAARASLNNDGLEDEGADAHGGDHDDNGEASHSGETQGTETHAEADGESHGAEGVKRVGWLWGVGRRPANVAVRQQVTDEHGSNLGSGLADTLAQAASRAAEGNIDTPPDGGSAKSDYFAGYHTSRWAARRGTPEDGETHERLTTRDFGVVFGMAIAHSAVVPGAMRKYFVAHDVTQDAEYKRLRREGQLAPLVARFADALENAAAGGDESTLVYVGRTADKSMGYGLYAARALPAGTVLGEYGGRYVRVPPDGFKETKEYTWDLPPMTVNGTTVRWAVDAGEWGNALRFCNDLGPGSWNVALRYVPWNAQWHVVYETITPVLENEQLSVEYGADYWARRRLAAL